MIHFTTSFTVPAPLAAVAAFHGETRILKKLSPPPLFVQIHEFGEMKEGMVAKFTMWFGPVPVYWEAVHSQVSENGFTDTQQIGPLKSWQHSHRFVVGGDNVTRIHESILYEHPSGWRGWLTRLVFSQPGLRFLFLYRQWVTRRGVARLLKQKS
jgi:ligand-binding SRPBCC domain-containing protein